MIKIDNPAKCCGCTACASVCAHDAIRMEPDSLGFLYPIVDESKCIDCGLCNKVCQFNENYDRSLNLPYPIAYAARHLDINEVMRSRSGAAFVALSDYILDKGGVVYGAGFNDHFRVVHKRANNKKERDDFRGSKYVQSDLTGVFRQVKDDLKNGSCVLFSGTPCQTAGLSAFVGAKLRDRLYLIDIICHGVPSPYIWRDYLYYVNNKYRDDIIQINFRDKEKYGWKDHKESFTLKKGKLVCDNLYTTIFYKHIAFRYSCGECYYTNLQRPSDITLADFWGWEKNVPEMNKDDKGISLLLLNTKKGVDLFETAKHLMETKEVDVRNCIQTRMQFPSPIHPLRDQFEKDYSCHGFNYILKKYIRPNLFRKIFNKLKYGRAVL